MSWRDIVRKSGCTAKMGTCSCEECLNKMGRPDGQCNECGQLFFSDPRGQKERQHMTERHGQANKGGCPHCDGNAPKSECICGQTNKASKPDYIDIDGDGNKTESMKEAAKDKKKKPRPKNPFTRKD